MNGLISAAQLATLLADAAAVVVDCRFNLLDPAAGRQAWEQGHIPGAWYADLDQDLAAARTAGSGRHPLPDPEAFAGLLGSWGVTPDTLVVAYDDVGGAVAGRLWWLLRWVGHRHAALLDGGLPAWEAAGQPLTVVQPVPRVGRYPVQPGRMPVVRTAEVLRRLQAAQLTLIDARDPARFAGESEPVDIRAGHIPGALNRPFQANLAEDGRFKAPAVLRREFEPLLAAACAREVAFSCGSGVTACHNLFALELAGLQTNTEFELYVGSWSEWITSAERPCEPAMPENPE